MKATIQYISALEELMTATKSGKINWIRNRPESFKYKIMNEIKMEKIAKEKKVIPDPIDDRKFQE